MLLTLGFAVAHQTTAGRFDRSLDAWVAARFSSAPSLARWLADLGSTGPVLLASVALAGGACAVRCWRGGVVAVTAPLVSTSLTEAVFKPWFHRTLHTGRVTWLSYPSGHTTAAVTVLTIALVLMPQFSVRPVTARMRASATVAAAALGLAVAAGLVAEGFHYATDTIGGAALAIATVLLLSVAIDAAADQLRMSLRSNRNHATARKIAE